MTRVTNSHFNTHTMYMSSNNEKQYSLRKEVSKLALKFFKYMCNNPFALITTTLACVAKTIEAPPILGPGISRGSHPNRWVPPRPDPSSTPSSIHQNRLNNPFYNSAYFEIVHQFDNQHICSLLSREEPDFVRNVLKLDCDRSMQAKTKISSRFATSITSTITPSTNSSTSTITPSTNSSTSTITPSTNSFITPISKNKTLPLLNSISTTPQSSSIKQIKVITVLSLTGAIFSTAAGVVSVAASVFGWASSRATESAVSAVGTAMGTIGTIIGSTGVTIGGAIGMKAMIEGATTIIEGIENIVETVGSRSASDAVKSLGDSVVSTLDEISIYFEAEEEEGLVELGVGIPRVGKPKGDIEYISLGSDVPSSWKDLLCIFTSENQKCSYIDVDPISTHAHGNWWNISCLPINGQQWCKYTADNTTNIAPTNFLQPYNSNATNIASTNFLQDSTLVKNRDKVCQFVINNLWCNLSVLRSSNNDTSVRRIFDINGIALNHTRSKIDFKGFAIEHSILDRNPNWKISMFH